MAYEEIVYAEDGPVGTITLNRPDDGNMFTPRMCHEIRECINDIRRETRTRVIVLTGAGERFFCIGGRKQGMEKTTLYPGTLQTLEMYESIDRLQKTDDRLGQDPKTRTGRMGAREPHSAHTLPPRRRRRN